MRIALLVFAAAALLSGCSPPPPQYEEKDLGIAKVSDHKVSHGAGFRQLCQFRVVVAGVALGYADPTAPGVLHGKCMTLKNGDKITVRKRTRISGSDNLPAV